LRNHAAMVHRTFRHLVEFGRTLLEAKAMKFKILKPTNRHMDIAFQMYTHWASNAEDDLREKWYRSQLAFWVKESQPMCTIRWGAFDLDIASWIIPDDLPTPDEIDGWKADQNLVYNTRPSTEDESKSSPFLNGKGLPEGMGERVTVPNLVDAFFDGEWTPHWFCGTCRKRLNGNMVPH